MKRAVWPIALVAAALLAGGCARRPKEKPPEIVAVKVAAEDMARYRTMARDCGAVEPKTRTIGDATLLVVGQESPLAARDCFFEKARDDYRAEHPVRAWIEDRIG